MPSTGQKHREETESVRLGQNWTQWNHSLRQFHMAERIAKRSNASGLLPELSEEVITMNGSRNMKAAARDIQPVDREPSETRLERMERYTNYLEDLIMRKNEEMRLWRRTMALCLDEEIQKAKVNEQIMIHQIRQAAMGELLETVAKYWRQPLHVIALVVRNMKDAWEAGELDRETLDNSISQAMEQISLLSRSIDDFGSFTKPDDHSIENNMNVSIRAENFHDGALFGIRLSAEPSERSRE